MKTLIILVLFMISCTHSKALPPLKTVPKVDLSKFMTKWYVIANIPTRFEIGATNAIEEYTWNSKKERIDISFTYRQDHPEGELKSIPQKGFIYNSKTNAEWRVQPFWPLKFAYLIIELADDYSYTVIGVPSRNYVWIMAKTPIMKKDDYDYLVQRLKETHHYDIEKLQLVPQSW